MLNACVLESWRAGRPGQFGGSPECASPGALTEGKGGGGEQEREGEMAREGQRDGRREEERERERWRDCN